MSEAAAVQTGTVQTEQQTNTQVAANGGQGANPAWFSSLPEEDRTHLTAKGWNDPDPNTVLPKIYKSAREAERMISTIKGSPDRIIVAPKDMNNPEEVSAYHKGIGVPSSVDGYELGELDPVLKTVAETALKNGVPKSGMKAVVDTYRQAQQAAQQEADKNWEAQGKRELDEYKASLGADMNTETRFFNAGKQAFPELAEKAAELERVMGVTGYVKHMAKLGRMAGEDTALGLGSADATALRGSEQQLAQFKMDANKMAILTDQYHPQHQATLAEWNRLMKDLY